MRDDSVDFRLLSGSRYLVDAIDMTLRDGPLRLAKLLGKLLATLNNVLGKRGWYSHLGQSVRIIGKDWNWLVSCCHQGHLYYDSTRLPGRSIRVNGTRVVKQATRHIKCINNAK